MATEVNLPALGESVTEGTVTRWLKQVGDQVAVDEPLLEVSTDKVDTEIPSPVAGTLLEIKANEDDTVEVGAVLGIIGEEGRVCGSSGFVRVPRRSRAVRPQTNPRRLSLSRRSRLRRKPSPRRSPSRSPSPSLSPSLRRSSPPRLPTTAAAPAKAAAVAAASPPRSRCPPWASR